MSNNCKHLRDLANFSNVLFKCAVANGELFKRIANCSNVLYIQLVVLGRSVLSSQVILVATTGSTTDIY